ncbi:MAG: hypothetical protein J3Q66DRAFT_375777 [Benniella sp.]|nr:MAG: hypothetical protein J3Q66DRAFT_375777 [Benniella sp.]
MTFNEGSKAARKHLLACGLVPLRSNDNTASTAQSIVASKILDMLYSEERPTIHIGRGIRMDVPRSDAIYVLAANHLKVDVLVFSTKRQLRIFRPPDGSLHAVGFIEVIDTFEKTSDTMVLGQSRTMPREHVPQPVQPIRVPSSDLQTTSSYGHSNHD